MDRTGGRNDLDKSQTKIEIRIRRFNPQLEQTPYDSVYILNFHEGMTLYGALDYIYKTLDPTIAFRPYKCDKGICTSCVVSVNGNRQRACTTFLNPGDCLLVEPSDDKYVVRDLVTIL
jgi:succinate dehydrogenase/fumarate reductase-like Fe-S protein